jgi:uncharacterized protein (TIGR02594 family)
MSFPAEYQWLLAPELRPLPKVIQVAIRELGVAEIVGKGSNDRIMRWRDQLNAAGHKISGFSDDDIPWCGLFVAYVCMAAGKDVVKDPLWAKNWAKYGTKVTEPCLGDILVYQRPGGGGHVEFYIAETDDLYIGIGGNKTNRVKISPIEKSRCIAIRRPAMTTPPASMRPFKLDKVGEKPTTNEA